MPKKNQEWMYVSVGFFILSAALSIVFLLFQVSGNSPLKNVKTYDVYANFNDIGGLRVHAPVTISGVKVGEVARIGLNPEILNAKVTLRLAKSQRIPIDDVSARIVTEGLLGANYISITPGFDGQDAQHAFLRSGDVIAKTQDAMILENLIGQLLFNAQK